MGIQTTTQVRENSSQSPVPERHSSPTRWAEVGESWRDQLNLIFSFISYSPLKKLMTLVIHKSGITYDFGHTLVLSF
ncbi:hypothetical protein CDG77_29560 [Nostoc sp. 'Peltigera membranacea cyanobiont' 213]|nr:hypothetical protein CDG77_29560 [Nostoc sp. 'Peltigera membranacea cyanobiont' 213]